MPFAIAVVSHTPIVVWGLLAYLVWQGIQGLKTRELPIWRMLIVPAVFIVWGGSRLVAGAHGAAPLLAWSLPAVAMAATAYLTGPRRLVIDHADGRVIRHGSVVPLIRNLTVFGLQYAVAVMGAIHMQGEATASLVARAVSGATAGYFIGFALALVVRYRRALREDPQAAAGRDA